jgi:hypothetical protein
VRLPPSLLSDAAYLWIAIERGEILCFLCSIAVATMKIVVAAAQAVLAARQSHAVSHFRSLGLVPATVQLQSGQTSNSRNDVLLLHNLLVGCSSHVHVVRLLLCLHLVRCDTAPQVRSLGPGIRLGPGTRAPVVHQMRTCSALRCRLRIENARGLHSDVRLRCVKSLGAVRAAPVGTVVGVAGGRGIAF